MTASRLGIFWDCLRRDLLACVLAAGAVVLAGQVARADYQELRQEMSDYQPPALVGAALSATPAPAPSADAPADLPFQAQVDALRAQGESFRKALTAQPSAEAFLVPDPARLAALRPAASDLDFAAQTLAKGFSVQTLEILTLLRSPAVQAKESELLAVLEGYTQVENLDTSLRRYATLTKSLMTGVGGMTNPDQAALKFPFPGVLALKGEIVSQEARAAVEELEAARRQALTQARRDFAELVYLGKAQELSQSLLLLLDNLQATVAARYQSGAASFQELTSRDIERQTVKEDLTTLQEERKNIEQALRASLNLAAETVIGRPEPQRAPPLGRTLAELNGLALERRQELRAQRAMIGRMERMLEMAETMTYPGLSQDLSLFGADEVSRVSGERPAAGAEQGAMAGSAGSFPTTATADSGTGLPKAPWFGANDAYLRQTRQRLATLERDLAATRAATLQEVRLAWYRLDKASRQEALYRERIVILSQANLDAANQGYAAGRLSFVELIETARNWLTANLTLARAQADLLAARAELEAAVGVGRLE